MPWKESSVLDERIRFVIRLNDGESMASLCREFGISRKTGYKIAERYEECGFNGLSDRSRKPYRYANQLPPQVEAAIVAAKREKPNWGARKIRERLLRRLRHEIRVPACSTIHAVLDRHGLVTRGGKPRVRAQRTPLSEGSAPNDLWCVDYNGATARSEVIGDSWGNCNQTRFSKLKNRYRLDLPALLGPMKIFAFERSSMTSPGAGAIPSNPLSFIDLSRKVLLLPLTCKPVKLNKCCITDAAWACF